MAASDAHWPAAAWSATFAGVHGYWALGGRLGLPPEIVMAERPLLLAIDIIAIPLCLGAAAVATLCGKDVVKEKRRSWVRSAAWAIALFCYVHCVPPLSAAMVRLARSGRPTFPGEASAFDLLLYEPWWLLGGMAFAWVASERRRPT